MTQSRKKPAGWKLPERYGDPAKPTDPETGKRICGSYKVRLNKYGDPVCISPFLMTNGKCRLHGGATPRGIASPHYKGKGQSQDIPTRLIPRYVASLNDPHMTSLAKEVALIDARRGELLALLDSGESGAIWDALGGYANDLEDARLAGQVAARIGDSDAQAKAAERLASSLNDVISTIRRGATERGRWLELYDNMERRRRMIDTMRRQRKDVMQFVTGAQLIMAFDEVTNLIRENVDDKQALTAIAYGITRIMQRVDADTDDGE